MDTIFAPITPNIKSPVTVIRISGGRFRNCLVALGVERKMEPRKSTLLSLFDNGVILDNALVTYFKAPFSFTGEDVVEIALHGSRYIVSRLMEILGNVEGVRPADRGEFSYRAFLNNKMDLLETESIVDLIEAETKSQHELALKQMQGTFSAYYNKWRSAILSILSLVEANIDFPDEDIPVSTIDLIQDKIAKLTSEIALYLNDNNRGERIRSGFHVAIIGSPNVGKSSLLNLLAQRDVAIVSDIAGTTRDILEVNLDISGMPVNLYDTAGLHVTNNIIENEGIKRALNKADNADFNIVLYDATSADKSILSHYTMKEKDIIVYNKVDLLNRGNLPIDTLGISVKDNKGIDRLIEAITSRIEYVPGNYEPILTKERHRIALRKCYNALSNFSLSKPIELAGEDLRVAAYELGKVTGKIGTDEILGEIFSSFCVGK